MKKENNMKYISRDIERYGVQVPRYFNTVTLYIVLIIVALIAVASWAVWSVMHG
jgi:hypothetical protein